VSEAVFDASALLAYLNDEPGGGAVEQALAGGGSVSAVNWAEVLTKAGEAGVPARALTASLVDRGLLGQILRVVPFDEDAARRTAELREATRGRGLSLADRACLALAQALGLPAWTADREWKGLLPDVEVVLVR
jgi:PIN domain nuclease of toxin-antitoxin system